MPSVTHSLVMALRRVPDFAAADDDTAVQIVGASANLFWPKDAVILEEGQPSEGLFVILSGRVKVVGTRAGVSTMIREIGPGDFFGELSLLLETAVSKNVVAAEDTELMVIPKECVKELVDANPQLGVTLRRKMDDYL